MDLEALAVQSGALQGEGCREPEAHARDGGAGDLLVEGGSRRADPSDGFNTADSGETVCGVRAHEREGVPVARADVLREEAEATRAEAHGSWGEAIDVVPVQEGVLKFLFRDAVG